MMRGFKNFFQVGSLVMLLVTVALISAFTTMHFAIHGAEVEVPRFTGMTVAEARSQAAGMGLNLNVDNRYYSGDVTAGHILTQSPAPGTVVRRAWRVRVAESLGAQKVDVPDTVGGDQRLAVVKLRRVGLDVGQVVELPTARAAEGAILAQDPPAHAQGIARPTVNLLVAAAGSDAPDAFLMPDLTGMLLGPAQAELARVGIQALPPAFVDVHVPPVGAPGSAPRPPVRPGSILAQQPAAGSRIEQSMPVKLTVAR
jgi:beta-lactam-binding protein with PASTA domain